MHSPKLSQLSNRQKIKPNNEDATHNMIRIGLLIWAFPRLAVSLLWTGAITLASVEHMTSPHSNPPRSRLFFDAFAILIQLVELTMLVTFIIAGFKKNLKLYLIYFRYCILTLITYMIAVTLCFSLGQENGHYFGDIYLFYSYFDAEGIMGDGYLLFFIASIIDVGLEIFLIFLIQKLINYYKSFGKNYTVGEAV